MYKNNKKLKVVNLFAGPGVGKSTIAAALFSSMKKNGNSVELVTEFAKDCVWDNFNDLFTEQDLIFAQQHHRLRRLVNHNVEYAITDSSLLITLLYQPTWFPSSFTPFALEVFNTYTNYNFFIKRNSKISYQLGGRNETLEEALQKDREMETILINNEIPFQYMEVSDTIEYDIQRILLK